MEVYRGRSKTFSATESDSWKVQLEKDSGGIRRMLLSGAILRDYDVHLKQMRSDHEGRYSIGDREP